MIIGYLGIVVLYFTIRTGGLVNRALRFREFVDAVPDLSEAVFCLVMAGVALYLLTTI